MCFLLKVVPRVTRYPSRIIVTHVNKSPFRALASVQRQQWHLSSRTFSTSSVLKDYKRREKLHLSMADAEHYTDIFSDDNLTTAEKKKAIRAHMTRQGKSENWYFQMMWICLNGSRRVRQALRIPIVVLIGVGLWKVTKKLFWSGKEESDLNGAGRRS
ncbi:uncharacterized protein PAC_02280 [Phialocephala subalpina]|uniref:Uncharacterized protein n=1 Tax=Phialocephala subalpina TaxID=576137 RepID=A0A1L7WI03_9HELO|nr:uncharacterized protein PAC_02280 [Phialocephala subalpina]